MVFRCTFFNQQQSQKLGGWAQGFWNSLTDRTTVIARAKVLRSLLDAVMGNQSFVNGLRISESGAFRITTNVALTGVGPSPVVPERDADYPTTSLQLVLNAAPNYRVVQPIRGIPDIIVKNSGKYTPDAGFLARFGALCGHLTSGPNGWCLYALDKTRATKFVQTISNLGVVTCPGHGLATNDRCRISKVKYLTQANAVWRVTVIDPNNFTLNGWITPNPALPFAGDAIMRPLVYATPSIQTATNGRISSHATGRPSNLLGGRRKRRRT